MFVICLVMYIECYAMPMIEKCMKSYCVLIQMFMKEMHFESLLLLTEIT